MDLKRYCDNLISRSSVIDFDELKQFDDRELNELCDELFSAWYDIRRTLDEQIIVNRRFCSNFFLYEAREASAKARYLSVKAYQMMSAK